jgi:hypothetical protein
MVSSTLPEEGHLIKLMIRLLNNFWRCFTTTCLMWVLIPIHMEHILSTVVDASIWHVSTVGHCGVSVSGVDGVQSSCT